MIDEEERKKLEARAEANVPPEKRPEEGKKQVPTDIALLAGCFKELQKQTTYLEKIAETLGVASAKVNTTNEIKAVEHTAGQEIPATVPSLSTVPPEIQGKVNSLIKALTDASYQGEPSINFVEIDATTSSNMILVRTKGYLGTEKYKVIAQTIKPFNPVWVKAGKDSHWEIPKLDIKEGQGEQTVQTEMPSEKPTEPTKRIDQIKSLFPQDLFEILDFKSEGGLIKIYPKQFLGSANFAKIASIVRDSGGEYVSAGKDSHFQYKE